MAEPGVKVLIVDRDGVINRDSDAFIRSPEEWVPIPGSVEALAEASRRGWRVGVATNQSGLARGLLDEPTLAAIHRRMVRAVEANGGRIDAIVYCPHGPDDGCTCRKPEPGLLHELARRFHVELEGVPVIGDSVRDLEAAQRAGAQPILVRTGKGGTAAASRERPGAPVFEDLAAAVRALLKRSEGERAP